MKDIILKSVCIAFLNFVICGAFPKSEADTVRNDFAIPASQKQPKTILGLVGGSQAAPHQFPYQVGMYITKSTGSYIFCGGSLVSNNYVLTAAHCTQDAKKVQVILGAVDITANEVDQIKLQTTNFTSHADWDSKTLLNDIALVALPQPVNTSSIIAIVKLAVGNDSFAGDNATVSGWGHTYNAQVTVNSQLLYFTTPVMSNVDCQSKSESYKNTIKPTHLCTSGDGGRSICNGDSGGPLVDNEVQIGVASFAWSSCEQSMPSVFTRISEYTDWIRSHSDVTFS